MRVPRGGNTLSGLPRDGDMIGERMNWDLTAGTTAMTGIIGGDGETTAAPELTSRALFERMPNGVAVLKTVDGEDGRPVDHVFVDVNEAFERILGFRSEDVLGRRMSDVMPGWERGAEDPVIAEGRGLKVDTYITRLEKWLTIYTYVPQEGYVVSFFEDITELRKTQERLQHSRTLASLGEMTAGIAHEVNNPLGSILLHSELMLREGLTQGAMQDLRVIRGEAKRAARIMTDLLTYSRRPRTEACRVDLSEIVEEVVGLRAHTHSLRSIQAHLTLETGRLFVEGDRSQMTQLLVNLIRNAEEAVKERPQGEIHVTTRLEAGWAKVSVADNGTGIPTENLKQIFYPFFTTRRTAGGTGLGLSTCHGIVTNHQGLIHAENNDMGGATLTVELPLAKLPRAGKARHRKRTKASA